MGKYDKQAIYGTLVLKEEDHQDPQLFLKASLKKGGIELHGEKALYELIQEKFFDKKVSITIRELKQDE